MNAAMLLLAVATQGDSVLVRRGVGDTTLATVLTTAGPALRADVLLPVIGGTARVTGFGRWNIERDGVTVALVDGVPFATRQGETFPLGAAPRVQAGAFLLPLRMLGDLVPRLGSGIAWDAERRLFVVTRMALSDSNRTAVASTSVPPAAAPATPRPRAPPPERPHAPHWIVVVDAGHGGVDPGMRGPIGGGPRIAEKDITLGVARKLARELESRGVSVVMTRTSDTLIALDDRGRIANRQQGNLFISIHVNAANPRWKEPGAARGFETYFLAEAKTEDDRRVARMENEVVRFEGSRDGPHDDALGFILSDMKQNEHLRESSELADGIQEQLARIHPGPNRGVKQAGFRVLVTSFMPSVLVEIGFGTNASEAAWISSDRGQRTVATAVADGAMEYLAAFERRSGGVSASGSVSPVSRPIPGRRR